MIDVALTLIVSLVFFCSLFLLLWRCQVAETRYWRGQAERYQRLWEQATVPELLPWEETYGGDRREVTS